MTPSEFCQRVNDSVVVGLPMKGGPSNPAGHVAICYAMRLGEDWLFAGFSEKDKDADPRPCFVHAYVDRTGTWPDGWAERKFTPIPVDFELFDQTRDVARSRLHAGEIIIPQFH